MKEVKYYPLTQAQLMLFFQMKYCIKKQCVNLCTEIEFQEDIDTNLMLQALYTGVLRSPALHIRLHKNPDKTIVQYFSDAAPEKLEIVDFSDKSEEEFNKTIAKWNGTPFPNKLMETQLYNLKLILKPNGKYAIYGNYCHIIADAYSIMATFKDIMGVYDAIKNQKPMPAPLPSPLPAYEADFKYQGSDKEKEDLKFFDEEIFDTEPQYTNLNGRSDKAFLKDKKYGKYHYSPAMKGDAVVYTIPAEVDKAATEFALANKVSPQAMYLLAIRTYLSGMCKVDDVTFTNTVARRATLAQKRAGGTMVNAIPLRFRFNNETTVAEACRLVYANQCESYRHANCSCGGILSMVDKKYNKPQGMSYFDFGTTYQPYFLIDDSVQVKFKRMPNGCETQSVYMSIMPCDNKGTISIDYSYQVAAYTPESLKKFHDFIVDFLREAVKEPEKTLSYFIEKYIK